MQFSPTDPMRTKALFYLLTVLVFILSVKFVELAGAIFASVSVVYVSVALFVHHRFEGLEDFSAFVSKGILGFVYMGLLPAFACKLLDLEHGVVWFLTLLAVVLTGDTFAYFSGMAWGKRKLMAEVSPKKTVVGAFGGLVGSLAAAGVCSFYLPEAYGWWLLALSAVAGSVAQTGDLFESVLKRVANQKDSGTLIPGHGGVLDRLDGVVFAAPILYLGAFLIEHYLR